MKLELLVFGITGFLIANTYYDGKYIALLKSWTKYYQMATYAFLGLSLYLFIKKHPSKSHSLFSHANGIIKYMPIDKDSSQLLAPFLDMTAKGFMSNPEPANAMTPQYKRMMNSGGQPHSQTNSVKTKRSVSETKKKFVASQQNWKCGGCHEQLSAWFEVDHHVRLDQGGSNHVDNLVALCRNCHGRKTAMENL